MIKTDQLTLPFDANEVFNIDWLIDTPNHQLIAHLKRQIKQRHSSNQERLNEEFLGILVHGTASTGKSHLLSGLAQLAHDQKSQVAYLYPNQVRTFSPGNLPSIVILDDVETFTANLESEQHLLSLIEQVKHAKGLLLLSASNAATQLSINLADLKSRLNAMDSFELHELDERQKYQALQKRAQLFGFTLSSNVCNWLFTHTSRNLGTLMSLLDQIDTVSLSEKRKVTIPLVKSILADMPPK